MGFYDNYNFDGMWLFSQIKEIPAVSEPCEEFLTLLEHLKKTSQNISVAEVGIGAGATTLRTLEILDAGDEYYAFDFLNVLKMLLHDLNFERFNVKCKVVAFGNSELEWDSYNWNLSNLIFQMRERNEAGLFDAAYLDGAHTFLHDGLALCLLKELLKDGGFLVLDDVDFVCWPDYAEAYKKHMPENQMRDKQILRVRKLFLDNDPNYEALTPPNSHRAVFRKRIAK